MGTSKKNAKGRLDKYYHMAKEHGYRSRAAFKLIQLNKKYDFLTNAKVVVDLCAAPGGWLQVASKYMPMASIKIGVDLDVIKPIKGCITFQCDITTPKCVALIKKELKHFQADIVMNDGAPNVGTDWNLDAYMQIELSLHAVKLATQVLKKGGTFICKVFRSKDYNSFLYVLNSLFTKVESSKPPSSRSQSAEIFMVCLGYKAPDYIDPKFLDPKHVFEDIENSKGGVDGNALEAKGTEGMSLKQFLKDKRPNRSGYVTEKIGSVVHEVCDLFDFLESADPFEFLTKFQQFKFDRKAEDALALSKVKIPVDLKEIIADIRVCGRSELNKLLTTRHKYQATQKPKKVVIEKEELDPEAQIEKELDEAINRIEKEKKRQAKKERELKVKQVLRQKMSVIATSTGIDNDEELNMQGRLWDELREKGFEHLDQVSSEESDSNEADDEGSEEEMSLNSDVDEKQLAIERMAQEMEDNIQKQKDYASTIDRKSSKYELKKKQLMDQQRQLREDMSDDEAMMNKDLMDIDSENSENSDPEPEPLLELMEGKDNESEGHSSSDEPKNSFVNPLAKKKKTIDAAGEISEGEWSDDDNGDDNKKQKKDKLLGKRKRGKKESDDEDVAKDFFGNNVIQEVPANDPGAANDESMDSDEMAQTRILAKKMLRKKARSEILDATFNRYSFHEAPESLPTWFVEDESKHYYRRYNATKEEIAAEKEEIKAYNTRPSKKVEEAKARKKKRLVKAMQKIKTKAQVIADQDINEQTKMKQIQKMYAKEKSKHVEEKNYIVNSKFNSAQGRKVGRGTKLVDSRLKKDLWKQKKNKGKKAYQKKGKK